MNGPLLNSTTIPLLEQVVNFAEARHAILAGNIANLDTPGYKVRDLSLDNFQARLREAIDSRRKPLAASAGDLRVRGDTGDPLREVRDSIRTILHHDDSDVGLEQQVTELSKNQMMHNLALAIMTSQFRLLQTAVSERI